MNPGRRGVLLAVAGVATAGHSESNSTEALLMLRRVADRGGLGSGVVGSGTLPSAIVRPRARGPGGDGLEVSGLTLSLEMMYR